jgi:hypothetical protein
VGASRPAHGRGVRVPSDPRHRFRVGGREGGAPVTRLARWLCDHDETREVLAVAEPLKDADVSGGSEHFSRVVAQGATTYQLTCCKCGRKRIAEVYGVPLSRRT